MRVGDRRRGARLQTQRHLGTGLEPPTKALPCLSPPRAPVKQSLRRTRSPPVHNAGEIIRLPRPPPQPELRFLSASRPRQHLCHITSLGAFWIANGLKDHAPSSRVPADTCSFDGGTLPTGHAPPAKRANSNGRAWVAHPSDGSVPESVRLHRIAPDVGDLTGGEIALQPSASRLITKILQLSHARVGPHKRTAPPYHYRPTSLSKIHVRRNVLFLLNFKFPFYDTGFCSTYFTFRIYFFFF